MELSLIHLNKIKKGMIKIFNNPYIKVLQVLFKKCSVFQTDITNQVDNQSDTELQFNLNTCIQVHETKYSMNPILHTPKIVWVNGLSHILILCMIENLTYNK